MKGLIGWAFGNVPNLVTVTFRGWLAQSPEPNNRRYNTTVPMYPGPDVPDALNMYDLYASASDKAIQNVLDCQRHGAKHPIPATLIPSAKPVSYCGVMTRPADVGVTEGLSSIFYEPVYAKDWSRSRGGRHANKFQLDNSPWRKDW